MMPATGPDMSAGITVNGTAIPAADIAAEAQNHPAETPLEAWRQAARALAIRELLVQEARRLGLVAVPQADPDDRRETEEEALIRQLVAGEVTVPQADEVTCRRYYDNNPGRFRSPDLFEAAHILLAASPQDQPAYREAAQQAESLIAILQTRPQLFDELARRHSACPSKANGGRLGQVTRGQTVEEFETFLFNLEEGQLCPVPVKTRYGVHILRLDRRLPGRTLPFDAVAGRIADYLHDAAWRRGVAQYIQVLAGRADLRGVDLAGAEVPLVQ